MKRCEKWKCKEKAIFNYKDLEIEFDLCGKHTQVELELCKEGVEVKSLE